MEKSNGICQLCKENEETITHLIYECKHVKPVWLDIQKILANIIDNCDLNDVKLILFGCNVKSSIYSKHETLMVNYVITITKWLLWKHRNDFKYGNIAIKTTFEKMTVIKKTICSEFNIFLKSRSVERCDDNLLMLIFDLKKLLTSDC